MAVVTWAPDFAWVKGRLGSLVFRMYGSGGLVRAMPIRMDGDPPEKGPFKALPWVINRWNSLSDADRLAWSNLYGGAMNGLRGFKTVMMLRSRFYFGDDLRLPEAPGTYELPASCSAFISVSNRRANIVGLPELDSRDACWAIGMQALVGSGADATVGGFGLGCFYSLDETIRLWNYLVKCGGYPLIGQKWRVIVKIFDCPSATFIDVARFSIVATY